MVVGVDGCRAGWVAAALDESRAVRLHVHGTFSGLWLANADASLLLVDIPIGLAECLAQTRKCDKLARQRLGPRRHSVFTPPCRQALAAKTYEEACTVNLRHMGTKLSRQTFGICPKIREVDDFLAATLDARQRVREVHPEVCFAGLAGHPARHGKKTREGRAERLELLHVHIVNLSPALERAQVNWRRREVGVDDLLDAALGAVTAALPERLSSLPAEPQFDPRGLRMEMVYRDA